MIATDMDTRHKQMKGFLVILMLAALAARYEAAEFNQFEERRIVLAPEEGGHPGHIVLQPEQGGDQVQVLGPAERQQAAYFFKQVDGEFILQEEFEEPEGELLTSRNNLILGSFGIGDLLLGRYTSQRQGIPGMIVSQDTSYRGIARTRISCVRVMLVGPNTRATPMVVAGGLGNNHVTIRIISAMGNGFHYNIDVWGR